MKWIKASERQPEEWENTFCRTTDNKIRFIASELVFGAVYGAHPYLNIEEGLLLDSVEWLDESTDWIKELYTEIEALHPYKERGNPNSYSSFNEGWADACAMFESELEKYFEKSKK